MTRATYCSSYPLKASSSILSPFSLAAPQKYRSKISVVFLNCRVNGSIQAICRMGNLRMASPSGTKVLLTERSQACGSRWVRMNFAFG